MASFNKVLLMGNLTRDPELRRVGDNNAVCNFGLAVNRRYSTSAGEEREDTCFVDIEAWGRQAETCERYLRKGRPVLVEGRLQQDRWEDKESGAPRSKLLVRAINVQFLGGRDAAEAEGASGGDSAAAGRGVRAGDPRREEFQEPPPAGGGQVQEEDDIPF